MEVKARNDPNGKALFNVALLNMTKIKPKAAADQIPRMIDMAAQ